MYSKLGKLMGFLSVLMTGIFCSLPAWAQEAATAAGQVAASAVPAAEPTGAAAPAASFLSTASVCALGLAIAAFGGSIGQGNAVAKAMEGIARNPEASAKMQTLLLLGLAFIESLTIYALLVCFILP